LKLIASFKKKTIMKKIINIDKKTITLWGGIGLAILIFFVFVYLPSQRQVTSLKKELEYFNSQISSINSIIDKKKSFQENIFSLQERLKELDRFPHKEEQTLKIISDIAKESKIDIKNLAPRQKQEFIYAEDLKLSIDGKGVIVMPVLLSLRCAYNDLIVFLTKLNKDLPAFISVESLEIERSDRSGQKLAAILELNIYLLL